MLKSKLYNNHVAELLKAGEIGVGPTDTIYGILALANNESAVEAVYKLKGRRPDKPCIILIDKLSQLSDYGVSDDYIEKARHYWPAPITLVLPTNSAPDYLTRGHKSLAFRMPDKASLRKLIRNSGPLIAPSANPEGEQPSLSVAQARKYFGEKVSFYVGSNHPIEAYASTILRLEGDSVEQLR